MARCKKRPVVYLFSLLETSNPENWNKLKNFLARESSCINKTYGWVTPLIHVLMSRYCPIDWVRLLLNYGADPNLRAGLDWKSPLHFALESKRDAAVIRLLIEGGADVNARHRRGRTFCTALINGGSVDVLRLLLETGCDPNDCWRHKSILECGPRPTFGGFLKEGVLDLLIEARVDVLRVGGDGESPVCLALQAAAGLGDILRLLKLGASLDACRKHASPLLCATDFKPEADYQRKFRRKFRGIPLKADVVELLRTADAPVASVNREGYTPLQLALNCCIYQKRAIKLLLGLPGVDFGVKDDQNRNLLHLAVENFHCKKSVVKSLIERGVKVDELNAFGQTPLRVAVERCAFGVVKLLLKYSSPVNAVDTEGETPVSAAVRCRRGFNIIRLLLFAGARIGATNNSECNSLLLLALDHFLGDTRQQTLDILKLLLKFCLLENPDIEMERLVWRHRNVDGKLFEEMTSFANKCANEVQIMKSNDIGINRHLFHFVERRSFPTQIAAAKIPSLSKIEFNQLLSIMIVNDLSQYFELISSTVGKSAMETKLQKLQVYATRNMIEETYLDYDSVCDMCPLLPAADLLSLILAYAQETHFGGNEDKRKGKRSPEQLVNKFQKHQKLNE